jgi:hypothetical protein
VEFVCLFDSLIVPIEVKSDKNLRSQSLNRYISEYGPEKAVKISMNPDLRNDGVNVRIPLWLSWNITDIISGGM